MQFAQDHAIKAVRIHESHWANCVSCPLHKTRNKVVLWRGYVPCEALFVGEAPGPNENDDGFPFTGPAGNLLDDMILAANKNLKLTDEWRDPITAFCNVIACIPPSPDYKKQVREPTEEEITACQPRLEEFLGIAKPRVTILVGDIAKSVQLPKTYHIVHPSHILKQRGHLYTQLYLKSVTILMQALQAATVIPF